MDPSLTSLLLLDSAVVLILVAAWTYFHRVRMPRPPVGVFNLRDVAITFVVLVVIPPLYLTLPTWLVASFLVLMATGLIYLTVSPAAGRRVAILVTGGLAGGELALTVWGFGGPGFVVLNDIAVGLLVVGVCNTWANSGVRARDVTVFACTVGVFDLVATWLLPLMQEFLTQVRGMPFAPMLAVGTGPDAVLIGLGDLLFIVLWPLVAVKAFAVRAGLYAAVGTTGCVVALSAAFYAGLFTKPVPAMVFIAPVILVQYWLFRRRYRTERTTGEYEAAAARPGVSVPSPPPLPPNADLTAALAMLSSDDDRQARYLAVRDGVVIGTGSTPGMATMEAGKNAPAAIPVIVLSNN